MKIITLFAILVGSLTTITLDAAYAGELPTAERCYDAGYRDGQNNPFDVVTFQECDTESKFKDGQNQYEEGFLDGCDAVKGNTRAECEAYIE
jgi:hypothetical protein